MIETDRKKQQEAEFMQQHTITPQDFKKMIAEKMERAKIYSLASIRQQEILVKNR